MNIRTGLKEGDIIRRIITNNSSIRKPLHQVGKYYTFLKYRDGMIVTKEFPAKGEEGCTAYFEFWKRPNKTNKGDNTMKHIKFSVEPIGPDFQSVKVVILEQTHTVREFGRNGEISYTHKGYTLSSVSYPEDDYRSNRCFVRGKNYEFDNNAIILSVASYQKFKAAVEAYNEEFKYVTPMVKKKVERKHLKVSGTPIGPAFQTVEVKILEQTHFGREFGDRYIDHSSSDFCSPASQVRLVSYGGNSICCLNFVPKELRGRVTRSLYVEGARVKGSIITVSTAEWAEIIKAVEAYNKHFSGEDADCENKVQRCSEIVG